MRHRFKKNSSFGRNRGPRKALIRGLVQALVDRQRIKTTLPRAKCVQPLVERAITMGKKNTLHVRRILSSRYPWGQTAHKIIGEIAPRFKDRAGGYTRIIKLGVRSGDKASLAYLEFIDYKPTPSSIDTSLSKDSSATDSSQKKSSQKKSEQKSKKMSQATNQRIKKQFLKKNQQQKKRFRSLQKQSRRVYRQSP